jgi:site-specific DNA-adenine methylase
MSILTDWNDVSKLKNGDKISYKDIPYTITNKSYDQDYGGADYTFTITDDNNNKLYIVINHLGDISFGKSNSNLSENELKKIESGGRRKRRNKTKRNITRNRRRRAKKTRRYYK